MGLDRRRKYAQRRAELEVESLRQLLDVIIAVFDAGDMDQLKTLISSAKENRAHEMALFEGQIASVLETRSQSLSQGSKGSSAPEDDISKSEDEDPIKRPKSSISSSSSASVGSLNEVNTLTEDPNRNEESRATGYIGKESEIAWMQKLEFEANKLDRGSHGEEESPPPVDEPIASMSYHLDNLQIVDSLPVEPRLLPPKPWAARLLNVFFDSADHFFPLINKALFISQFEHAYSRSGPEPTRKWLAVFNLALAIGAKYYQLAEPEAGQDVDDRLFLSRAISLNPSHAVGIEHADLHQVQIDMLLAIYYLVSGQVNRSWQVTGRASRSAISLGLNLRTISDQIDPVSRETRTRLWWSIFSLEHMLSSMTGRSPCVDHHSTSAYPPIPYCEAQYQHAEAETLLSDWTMREDKLRWTIYASDPELESRTQWMRTVEPTPSLFFFYLMDLFVITHAAVKAIYNLSASHDTGQSEIPLYQKKLQTWLFYLPPPFAFTNADNEPTLSRDSRFQVSLAMAYYSAQIILSRPCLTRPDLKEGTNIRFPRSRFGNDTAKTCIHSAVALLSILPDEPDTDWLLRMTPWWCVLHFIMQAITILLIQLAVGQVPVEDGNEKNLGNSGDVKDDAAPGIVLDGAKKGVRWLHEMAERDASSERAFRITERFLRRIAVAKGLDLDCVPRADVDGKLDPGRGSSDVDQWRPKVQKEDGAINWGPDSTISEGRTEEHLREDAPFSMDPIFFSTDLMRGSV
ncbi:fungal-specific transcription factor domain-containing protein [Aspergillus pseudoustus]|uniref:Fungal-specific transcription factor domain-containing protein n=1 Tax=Aspergillus pseudoustus TaxID=1810923 RepID=A0ABR4KZ35_9EURO